MGPDNGMGGADGGALDAQGDSLNLDAILGGTSPQGETTPDLQGSFSGQGGGNQGDGSGYRFANRTWKSQQEAEAAWNKVYGGYSEQRGLVNQLKEVARRDPELASALAASDPKMAQILSKFGIEAATEESGLDDPRGDGRSNGPSWEEVQHEWGVMQKQGALNQELWDFEREMGRRLSAQERNGILKQIERAENLTVQEAYFLANRTQILRQQAQQNAASAGQAPQAGGRPKPPPRSMPGTPAPGKKSVADMSEAEWKENLRQSGIIKEMMSKRG